MSVASQSPRPASEGRFGEGEFDLPGLGAALWRGKWKILRPTILVAVIALGVVQLIPSRYLSESRVLIEARDNVFLRPEADKDVGDRGAVDPETVTSQVQLILSRDLASEVIDKLKLGERAEFDPLRKHLSPVKLVLGLIGVIRNPLRMTPQERVLEAYYDRLNVYAVEKSRVIVIDFLSEDPKLAARVADAIADAYLLRQRIAKQDQARVAGQWLSGEIDAMRQKVADAEAKVEAFRAKSNLLVGPNGTTLSAQSLGDLNAQLAMARALKADAEAKAKLIRQSLRSGATIESSDILNSELIRRLSEQRVTLRAQLAEQSSSLLDGHPRIKELKAQIADLDRQIRAEAETIARAEENDAKIASARVDSLAASLDQLKRQAAGTNEQDVELRALERDAKSERDLLESYLAKYREATSRDTLNSAPADARVISRATVSSVPAYPKKLATVLIAALATLVLSASLLLTRELLTAPIGGIGAAPGSGEGEGARGFAPPLAADQEPPVAVPITAIDDVASALREVGISGSQIAVLSAAHEVDTSAIAIKLARALSEHARVVLVGLGQDDQAIRAVSGEPIVAGLRELAAGTASFTDAITGDKLSRLHLVTSGREPTDRITVLSTPGIAAIFAALARSYAHVIIDAGAVWGPEMEALSGIAPQALLLCETATDAVAASARERLLVAGFADVAMLIGARSGVDAARAAAA